MVCPAADWPTSLAALRARPARLCLVSQVNVNFVLIQLQFDSVHNPRSAQTQNLLIQLPILHGQILHGDLASLALCRQLLVRVKKVPEPAIVLGAAIAGLLLYPYVRG